MNLLFIAILVLGLLLWLGFDKQRLRREGWKIALTAVAVFVLFALFTGRIHWITGAVALLFALAVRVLPLLPWLQKLRQGGGQQQTGEQRQRNHSGGMDAEQARAVLGLDADADREAIVAAHRRLIQKLHPDRGGSPELAAQINKAKEILLQQWDQRG